jgi:hypothetical protein
MNIKHIQILSEAEAGLGDGRFFYESQEQGIGEYFWDSLLSDIESLIIYAGVYSKVYGYCRMSSKRFPYSSLLRFKRQYSIRHCRIARTKKP